MLSNVQWYYGMPHTWSNNRVLHVTWSTRKDTHEIIRQIFLQSNLPCMHHFAFVFLKVTKCIQRNCISFDCYILLEAKNVLKLFSFESRFHFTELKTVSRHAVRWTRWVAALTHTAIWYKVLHCHSRRSSSPRLCNTMHADLPLSQIFFKNLTNPLFINQYLTLH